MLPKTMKEFSDEEIIKGFFDETTLKKYGHKDYYTFDEVIQMCNEKFDRYINELKAREQAEKGIKTERENNPRYGGSFRKAVVFLYRIRVAVYFFKKAGQFAPQSVGDGFVRILRRHVKRGNVV